jgi:hypothetical protein
MTVTTGQRRRPGFGLAAGTGLIASLMAGAAGPAHAQERPAYIRADPAALSQTYGPAIAARVFSNQLTGQRLQALQASAARIPGFTCPERPNAVLVTVFPWRGVAGRAAWIERFAVQCQPVATRNFLMVLEGDTVRVMEMAPGTSNTDPLLQRDLMVGIAGAAQRTAPAGCSQPPVVSNVRMLADPPPAPGRWSESWSVMQCGVAAEIRVQFQPSPQGGTTWTIPAR